MPYWVPLSVGLGALAPIVLLNALAWGGLVGTGTILLLALSYLVQWITVALSWAGEYLLPIAVLAAMAVLLSAIPWWVAMKTKELWNRRTNRCV